MALTFFWRCEGSTFSGTADYSAGDSTPTINNAPTFSSTQAKVGTNSLLCDDSAEYYIFDSASIINQAEGCFGFWFYIDTYPTANALICRAYDLSANNNHLDVNFLWGSGTGTGNLQFNVRRDAGGSTSVDTSGANLAVSNWYFCVVRWHEVNQDIRIEVYDSTLTLITSTENLSVGATSFPNAATIDTWLVGRFQGTGSLGAYFDNVMVGNTYAEPLEDYALYPSYLDTQRNVYINDAATLDGGEVVQTYPLGNWSDTSITMPDAPDTTGLSGQLYVIVENADGNIGSRAVTVGSVVDNPILVPTGPIR